MIVVVYLDHGIFHPVAVLFFSKKQFLGEVLSFQIEEPQNEVVNLYRTTRLVLLRASYCANLRRETLCRPDSREENRCFSNVLEKNHSAKNKVSIKLGQRYAATPTTVSMNTGL